MTTLTEYDTANNKINGTICNSLSLSLFLVSVAERETRVTMNV